MTPASLIHHLTTTLPNIDTATADGNTFFFIAPDRKMPFATLLTNDLYDAASHLARPDTFRLHLGISQPTYRSLFGPPPTGPIGAAVFSTPHDFTTLDQLFPHPIYAQMFWICILNPSDHTLHTTLAPLLTEAHTLAVASLAKRTRQENP